MRRIYFFVLLFVSALGACVNYAYAEAPAANYLCDIGVGYYRLGRYEDALHEFNKALMIEPNNATAKAYIGLIFEQDMPSPLQSVTMPIMPPAPIVTPKPPAEPPAIQESPKPVMVPAAPLPPQEFTKAPTPPAQEEILKPSREDMMAQVMTGLSQPAYYAQEEKPAGPGKAIEIAGVKVSGQVQLRLGMTSQDTYWKRANWDLNEKNWRMRSNAALNSRENTYDPRIYDRLRLNLDTAKEEGFNFHTNLTVDPWSFTGKSSKMTVLSDFGDSAEVELKYWSNSGYVVNQVVNSNVWGNSFALPEIKVKNGKVAATDVAGAFDPPDTFHIPETKIYYEFQPVRELWFGYNQDNLKLRVFPIAYENQALTFDDPLRLSNNRIWWEDSPWLHSWKPGLFNSGALPQDFTPGYWDNTLSFFARDSEGQRLSSLRGFSFEFSPQDETSLVTSVATPKNPWQDYSVVDNFLSASRLKQAITEDLNLGVTATTRFGYNVDNENKLDARNFVVGTDLSYEIIDGIKTTFETAYSQSEYDLTNSQYHTDWRGHAYHFSILGRFPLQDIMNTEYGYDGIKPGEYESFFTKFRFFAARLDSAFDQPLSSYVETRDDESWSRHIHFRKPFKYYYQGEGQLLTWDDIKNYRIGNGIDTGGSTLGLRVESLLWDKKVDNLFDVRNVHYTNGKFLQNVGRDELTVQVNDKLTTKLLGIYQHMPKTEEGIDPFIFNPRTGVFYDNAYIEGGKDPSLTTGSLGLEYQFFDWLALNGIWECTNDISLAYDNFPRGILNDGERSLIGEYYGNIYREVRNFLTDQQIFPRPPYPFYNIFKTGLRLTPLENLEVYLDYTRNSYEKAGQVDDNMNHIGLEVGYSPIPKLAMFFKYSYSRWQDLDTLAQGVTKVFGHHNIFTEFIYRVSEDEDFTFQYGEASRNPYMGGVLDIGWDPYGGSLRTIDTQHIFRLYYRRKF